MRSPSFFERVRAAYALAVAIEAEKMPEDRDFRILGLEPKLVKGFKRAR